MIWCIDSGWNKSVPPTILKAERPRSRNLIYISAGDRETFASYAIHRLSDHFDVAVFYYGRSAVRKTRLQEGATLFSVGRGAKFNSLKQLVTQTPGLLEAYETVWVCDDDVVPLAGDVRMVPDLLLRFNLRVISPAHAANGKTSHEIMLPAGGRQLLRCSNFVEMTCPMFRSDSLVGFMREYDGSLAGWGVDWWYLNYFGANKRQVAGVIDGVIFYNPFDSEKRGGRREIDRYLSTPQRIRQWERAKRRLGLQEWPHRNLARYELPALPYTERVASATS
jgi:hypothetical protein